MTTCSGIPTLVADEAGDIFIGCKDCGFYLLLGTQPSLSQVIAASYAHRYNADST